MNITVYVDTDEFDRSVRHCNTSLNGLTAAVIATEAAQVESKKASSKRIADTIIKGFFNYVGADLAQKIKELAAKCEATFLELMDQKRTCMEKTTQMRNDYQMISKRYSKIFEDLDRETISRIEQLDRPAFQFAETAQAVADRNCTWAKPWSRPQRLYRRFQPSLIPGSDRGSSEQERHPPLPAL